MESKKPETTIKLERQCEQIANCIRTGKYDFDSEDSEYDEPCAGDYLKDILDYQYIINSDNSYKASMILVCCGGPNIWINTRKRCVEGCWGNDEVKRYYTNDELGIDDYMEELYLAFV